MRQGSDGVQGLRASQSHLRAAHDATDGMEVMVGALKEAPDGSVTLMVVASLKDAAQLLHEHEALFLAKIKEVVIQGGVIPWAPDAPTEDRVLQPDAAHNNEFDREASAYVYKRCQECGVPLLVVSRFAAMQVQMPRQIYDELAATGSPVGIHLQKTQASSIERLWTQACAAEGSADRGSLPARCDKAWFVRTFCRGKGAERSGGDRIWDLVVGFNMYDPLALMAVLPCHAHYFSFERVTVDDTTHRVLGMDEERTGINPETKAELVQHLYTAFLQGINGAKRAQHVLQTLETERASARTIAMLREENAELRAQLKPHL